MLTAIFNLLDGLIVLIPILLVFKLSAQDNYKLCYFEQRNIDDYSFNFGSYLEPFIITLVVGLIYLSSYTFISVLSLLLLASSIQLFWSNKVFMPAAMNFLLQLVLMITGILISYFILIFLNLDSHFAYFLDLVWVGIQYYLALALIVPASYYSMIGLYWIIYSVAYGVPPVFELTKEKM